MFVHTNSESLRLLRAEVLATFELANCSPQDSNAVVIDVGAPHACKGLARVADVCLVCGVTRGLPVDRWTRRQTVIAYWGIALYWGNVVSQNQKGHIIGHVKNIGHDVLNPITRVYATTLAQPFHVDRCAPSYAIADVRQPCPGLPSHREAGVCAFLAHSRLCVHAFWSPNVRLSTGPSRANAG